MATFVLVHGSQHGAWCWDRLVPELRARGHDAIAPDLPCDDPSAGIPDYAQCVLDAMDRATPADEVVIVGHSLGSLTVPVVAERLLDRGSRVDRLVFLCSVPTGPGPAIDASLADMVTPAFTNARRTIDEDGCESLHPEDAIAVWFADCEPRDAQWAVSKLRPQSRRPLAEPSPLRAWPDVPLSVVLGDDDRCVNADWAVRAATARLNGVSPLMIGGGHSPFLTRPAELADVLVGVIKD